MPGPSPLPGRRSALLVTTSGYADVQLSWLRPPGSGASDLAAALAEPSAGAFAVERLNDGTEAEIRLAVSRFLAGRTADDTVVVYFSCHAIKDRARIYFAATDTWLRYPQRSAVPAAYVFGELDLCGAGNRLLILDCCFSGGFAEGNGELDLAAEFGLDGRGIAMLSGSRTREYSYEGRPIGPELPRSVFTEGLAVGLATGAADVDGDGRVTAAEAYNYAYRHVTQYAPRQAPQYYLEEGQGGIVLALAHPRTGPQPALPEPPTWPAQEWPTAQDRPGALDRPTMPQRAEERTLPQPAVPAETAETAPQGAVPEQRASRRAVPARAEPAAGTQGSGAHRLGARQRGTERSGTAGSPGDSAAPRAPNAPESLTVEQDRDNAYCVAFSPDGALLASGGWGRPARFRDVSAGRLVRELRSAGPSVYDLAFSPDGAFVATGGRDGTIALCEVATGKKMRSRKPGGAAVRAVAFSPLGNALVSAHEDGVARLWETPSLGRIRELRAGGETIFGAAFSPDGTMIAAACADGAVRLWSPAGGDPLAVLGSHAGWATGVVFGRDRTMLVSAGADGAVLLHNVMTGERTATLRAGDGIINAIALSPDGTLVVAAYETGALTVWDVPSGRHETILGHAGHVNDVAFSPDGRLLASAGKDGTVRLWR